MSVIDILRNMKMRNENIERQREQDNIKAVNTNVQQEKISRYENSDYYNDYLTSLVSSFFLHQAVCASHTTGAPVRINLIQNAKNSFGTLSPEAMQNGMSIYTFTDFCNAVKVTPRISVTNDVVLNSMTFSNNVLNNPAIDKRQLGEDIANISTVYEAVLATYAGTNKDPAFVSNLTGVELYSFFSIYARNPETAFNSDVFEYPDGHFSADAKETTDKMLSQDPKMLNRSLYFIVSGANRFQDQVASNSEDLNSNLEVNI